MLLNAQQILAAGDRKTVEVEVPEWGAGAKVLVGSIGAMAQAEIRDWLRSLRVPAVAAPEAELVTCDDAAPAASGRPLSCDSAPAEPQDAAEAVEEEEAAPEDTGPQLSQVESLELALRWCVGCILDPVTQRPAFTLAEMDRLAEKCQPAIWRIYDRALELSLASRQASEAFEKNSGRTSGPGSGGA